MSLIVDPSKLDTDQLRCQVCIIGSGAAGIALALELGKQKIDTILVAGGGYEQNAEDRALHEGTSEPAGSHEPLEEYRHRAFGGATKRWGGRLVPFEPIDFESRPFLPMSGWPIAFEDVASRFSHAADLCEVVADSFQQAPSREEFDLPPTLGNGAISTTSCERWSTPTDFGVLYRDTLAAMDDVRVLLGYHARDLRLDDDLQSVSSIRLVSRDGRPLRVTAGAFVLATGGLENARLLLASRSQIAAGVGNHSDMVGRCYMSHMSGTIGWLTWNRRRKPSLYRFQRDLQGAYLRRRFRLSDQSQRELRVMNIVGFPHRPDIVDPSHRDAVLSLLYLEHALFKAPRDQRPGWGVLARHASNWVFNNPAAWLSAARQIWLRSRRPRLPFMLPYNARSQDAFYFQGEHAPNLESRLVLSHERDEFGMPRIEARVRFSEIDYRTVTAFYRQLDHALRAEQLGRLEYDEVGLNRYLAELTTKFNSIAHHLGTTRMSTDPKSGVVDRHCKVHSVDNLYISGGSVFPTSGHANPTLTILALTLRLADHLANRLSRQLAAVAAEPPAAADAHVGGHPAPGSSHA